MVIMMNLFLAEPELTNIIGQLIELLYNAIGSFGWTVVVFTLLLKVVLMPLDIWQKKSTYKNNKIMKRMKPQLEKLQKQYANNREVYGAKQMELYKKEGYSLFASCLPMIFTLAIFMVVFQGFHATVRYHNEMITYEIAELYNQGARGDELADAYEERLEGWLWIDNIFMPDNWANIVPTYEQYSGSGIGKLKAEFPSNFNQLGDYDALIGPAMDRFNKETFWEFDKWNGWMILPLLAVALNFLTTMMMKNNQPEQPMQMGADGNPVNNAASMKMMQYMMPVMIGVFSLFYSSAFTIYLFVSAAFTGLFNLIFNIILKKADEKEEKNAAMSFRR